VLITAYNKTRIDGGGINHFLNITNNELMALLQIEKIANINFKRLSEVIHHPYISKQIEWFLNTSKESKIDLTCKFYLNILIETYEQRNLVEHAGIHNGKAVEKILLILPQLVSKFRSLIIDELKKNRHNSFKELIEKLQSDKSK